MIISGLTDFITKKRFSGQIIGLFVGLLICTFGILRPSYNWDMIGYVASAFHQQGLRGEELHRETFKEVQAGVTSEKFQELTTGHYRSTVYEKHDSLAQQIPFYSIRVVYVSLMNLAHLAFGTSLVDASYMISAFFAGALALLVFILLSPGSYLEILLYSGILYVSGISDIAGLSTPDTMAAFFSVLIIFAFIRNLKSLPLLIILLPAIRTDFVIVSGLFATLIFLKGNKISSILTTVATLALFFVINKLHGSYGHFTTFNFTFRGFDPYPANMNLSYDVKSYVMIYVDGAKEFIKNKHFLIYALYLGVWLKSRPTLRLQGNEIIYVTGGFVVIHLALFPAYFDRYFFWCALIALAHTYVILVREKSASMLSQFSR